MKTDNDNNNEKKIYDDYPLRLRPFGIINYRPENIEIIA